MTTYCNSPVIRTSLQSECVILVFGRLCWAVFCKYKEYIIVDSMQCKIVHKSTYVIIIILFRVTMYFNFFIIIYHYNIYVQCIWTTDL